MNIKKIEAFEFNDKIYTSIKEALEAKLMSLGLTREILATMMNARNDVIQYLNLDSNNSSSYPFNIEITEVKTINDNYKPSELRSPFDLGEYERNE